LPENVQNDAGKDRNEKRENLRAPKEMKKEQGGTAQAPHQERGKKDLDSDKEFYEKITDLRDDGLDTWT